MQRPGSIIIFSLTFHPFVGGAEIAIKEITARLQHRRFLLITAKLRTDLPEIENMNGVQIIRVGKGHWSDKYLYPWYAVRKAHELQKKEPIALEWAMMANYTLVAAFFSTLWRRIPYMLTEQSGDSDNFIRLRTWFWSPLYRLMHRRAATVQVISNFLATRVKKMGFRGQPIVIPNGVDLSVFKPVEATEKEVLRQRYGYTADDIVVVTTSRLVYKNAIDDLIRAMNIAIYKMGLPLKLAILGSGKDAETLTQLTERLGLQSHVKFYGHIDNKESVALLQASDIFCRPSRSEGLGISFLEAMAVGLPVVAPAVGGIPDFLQDGVNGLSCQVDKPATIAHAFQRLAKDPDLRKELGSHGREMTKERYNWDVIAPAIDELFSRYVSA